jgi:hypothetical protein
VTEQPPPTALPPGEPDSVQAWTWTLFTNANESAAELWVDAEIRLTIPLTADQVELLLGHPHTLASALEGFPGLSKAPEGLGDEEGQ